MRAPRSESTRLASLQSEFSLTPAGTKNAGHVTGSFSIHKNLAFIMIARRGSYKPDTKQNGSLPPAGAGIVFASVPQNRRNHRTGQGSTSTSGLLGNGTNSRRQDSIVRRCTPPE